MKKIVIWTALLLVLSVIGCSGPDRKTEDKDTTTRYSSMEKINKPFTRYWWFASRIRKEDIKYNLNWLKEKGFGGVEIAWVYPLNAMNDQEDTTYIPRQKWLSPEWQEIVKYALLYADSINLAVDLTMGTLWPFGDSQVTDEQASQQFGEEHRQKITKSWEYPQKGYVIDHLNPDDYLPYFKRILDSFPQPGTKIPHSYFIDSWEVETRKLWTDGFKNDFRAAYGYDIQPYMDSIYTGKYQDQLYDYMKLVSAKVINFYEDFDSTLNRRNLFSRGQCSGAPCDIISAYSRLDIPESEAMLYEPRYSNIPASAAVLSGKKVVSAESFTCLYGWPRNYIREEQTADLKMVADALFANGVNQIVWHGKPHNPAHSDSLSFYASVHVGAAGNLGSEIAEFNQYLTTVSEIMKKGKPYSNVAVYLPVEDAWMKGALPQEKQFIWAWGHYEMRYVYFPDELAGYHPIWINREFLEKAKLEKSLLKTGDASFSSLYINVEYLDYRALKRITELAKRGLPITLKQIPQEPGIIKHKDWGKLIEELKELPHVNSEFIQQEPALIKGENLPPFRARETEKGLYLFFAHPRSQNLSFPIEYGQSYIEETINIPLTINYKNKKYDLTLHFRPYQSLLFKIQKGEIEQTDIYFKPEIPVVKERPDNFERPWLVE